MCFVLTDSGLACSHQSDKIISLSTRMRTSKSDVRETKAHEGIHSPFPASTTYKSIILANVFMIYIYISVFALSSFTTGNQHFNQSCYCGKHKGNGEKFNYSIQCGTNARGLPHSFRFFGSPGTILRTTDFT